MLGIKVDPSVWMILEPQAMKHCCCRSTKIRMSSSWLAPVKLFCDLPPKLQPPKPTIVSRPIVLQVAVSRHPWTAIAALGETSLLFALLQVGATDADIGHYLNLFLLFRRQPGDYGGRVSFLGFFNDAGEEASCGVCAERPGRVDVA